MHIPDVFSFDNKAGGMDKYRKDVSNKHREGITTGTSYKIISTNELNAFHLLLVEKIKLIRFCKDGVAIGVLEFCIVEMALVYYSFLFFRIKKNH